MPPYAPFFEPRPKPPRRGDRIKFQAYTRWNSRPVWRVVNGITDSGKVTVRFGGWGDFVVRWHEILEVEHRKKNNDPTKEN